MQQAGTRGVEIPRPRGLRNHTCRVSFSLAGRGVSVQRKSHPQYGRIYMYDRNLHALLIAS